MEHHPVRLKLSLPPQDFRLGPWLIQPAQFKIVSSDGASVAVEPKMMYVLLCLVQQQGEVVSRDMLMDTVWPDVVIVSDTLTRCISELRKIFGDDPNDPRFIETIRKHGYRLLIPPQPITRRKRPLTSSPLLETRTNRRPSWVSWVLSGVTMTLLVYGLGWYQGMRQALPENQLVFLDSEQVGVTPADNVFHLNGPPISSLEAILLLGNANEDTVAVWHPRPATIDNNTLSNPVFRSDR